MKIEATYPKPAGDRKARSRAIEALKWSLLFAAYICPVINLCTGGRAWSVIVLWSLWMVWSAVVSPPLVEFNRTSQFIRLIACVCVLLVLIDLLLAPGWAVEVVPIVSFSGMICAGILFFTDLERQKQNMLPLLLLTAVSLLCSAAGLIVWRDESRWALVVMGALALALLTGCAAVLGAGFTRELKKRFHTK